MGGYWTRLLIRYGPGSRCLFQVALVFVIVAVDTQVFPVTAVGRIIVVIVILVVYGQFMQVPAGKLTAAACTDPWMDLQ